MNIFGLLILTFTIFHVSADLHELLPKFTTLTDDFRFLKTVTSTKEHIDTTATLYTSTTTVFIPDCTVEVFTQFQAIFCHDPTLNAPDFIPLRIRTKPIPDLFDNPEILDTIPSSQEDESSDNPEFSDTITSSQDDESSDNPGILDTIPSSQDDESSDAVVSQDPLQSREVSNVTEFPEGFEHFVRVILPQIGPELEKEMMNLESSRSDLNLPTDGGSRDDKFLKVEVKETWTSVVSSVFDVVSIVFSTSVSTLTVQTRVTVYQTIINSDAGSPVGVIECF